MCVPNINICIPIQSCGSEEQGALGVRATARAEGFTFEGVWKQVQYRKTPTPSIATVLAPGGGRKDDDSQVRFLAPKPFPPETRTQNSWLRVARRRDLALTPATACATNRADATAGESSPWREGGLGFLAPVSVCAAG